jgi:hypothetical protein
MTETPKMYSIWFFVGLVLMTMGGLVCLAGAIDFFTKTAADTVLAHTYPGLWWGAIMICTGGVFYFFNRQRTHD